jgi:hypothetical protein
MQHHKYFSKLQGLNNNISPQDIVNSDNEIRKIFKGGYTLHSDNCNNVCIMYGEYNLTIIFDHARENNTLFFQLTHETTSVITVMNVMWNPVSGKWQERSGMNIHHAYAALFLNEILRCINLM